MPHPLTLLGGIRLPFASDDLVIPSLCGIAVRVVVIPIFSALVALTNSASTTNCVAAGNNAVSTNPMAFLAWTLATCILNLALWVLILKSSSKGTIMDWQLRDGMTETLMHLLILCYLVQLAATVYGSVYLGQVTCPAAVVNTYVLVGVVISWLDLATALFFAVFFMSVASFLVRDPLASAMNRSSWYEENIPRLFTCLGVVTCGIAGQPASSKHATAPADIWHQISSMVAIYMNDLDGLVLTDILAAIVLLRVDQRYREKLAIAKLQADATDSRVLSSVGSPVMSTPKLGGGPRRGLLESFLYGASAVDKPDSVRLKVQALASATPVSPRGSWISEQMALEGRVANAQEHLAARVALEDAEQFLPYMLGVYGWKLHLFLNPMSGVCDLLRAPAMRSVAGNENLLEGKTFKMLTGVEDHNVVYASFTNYLGEAIPYVVSIDHDKRAVIISCRGTLSISDLVTDLHCMPTSLESAGKAWGFNGKEMYAHGGMLKVALKLRADIEKSKVLHKIFTRGASSATSPLMNRPLEGDRMLLEEGKWFMAMHELDRFDVDNYRLVVVGHSLGGGIGAILTLLLRNSFPLIRCIAYSPPGCIFDLATANASSEYVTSIWPGKDAVPRLSWHSMKQLRAQLLEMLRRCKVDKWTAIRSYKCDDPLKVMYDPHKVPTEPNRVYLANRILEMANEAATTPLDQIRMYLPGKILYLCKTYSETETIRVCCCLPVKLSHPHFAPFWVQDRTEFQEVLVSVRMLLDHIPSVPAVIIRETNAFEKHNHQGYSSNPGFVLGHNISPGRVEVPDDVDV
jgi:hypothetical protein